MSYDLTAERTRHALKDHTARMAVSARAAGPDALVPTAPEWNVANLVEHLGQSQNWVAEILERRVTDPSQLPGEMAVAPTDSQSWVEWLRDSAARAAEAASDAALEAQVWNASGDERSGAQFWLHSLLNEAVVHGFDAAAAAAGSAAAAVPDYDIRPDVAAELITNHLAMLTSPTWAAQRPESADAARGTGQTLLWHATDAGPSADWTIERLPEGARVIEGSGGADVTIAGPGGTLLLVLTRRLTPDEGLGGGITMEGDAELVRHWVDHTAHVSG